MEISERRRILTSLEDEENGIYLYRALAEIEKAARVAEVYRRMGEVGDQPGHGSCRGIAIHRRYPGHWFGGVVGWLLFDGPGRVAFGSVFIGLFIIGAGTSLFTGRGVIFSGMRRVTFGLLAAAATFLIGRLIGVNISG